jgi:threonine synthase
VVWACQAEGSSAIARALTSPSSANDPFGPAQSSKTVADSIAVDVPRNGLHALTKLKRYGGQAVTISDAEILAAQKTLSAGSGLFAEPSSSAAFAGWLKVRNRLAAEENCVVLITGSGLKDIKSAAQGLGLNT